MSEAWKQWEGRIVDGKFPLRQYLGSSDHSAVFLTERGDPAQKVAIKFIQVDPTAAELQLSRWQAAAKLSHPHLLRLFECGRCRIGDFNLLYLVIEYANENLAQFLPQRPLTPAETRDVLGHALDALNHLHRQGLAHGHIQPSNILAIDDQLKLSSDTVAPVPVPKPVEKDQAPEAAALDEQPQHFAPGGESATLRRPSAYLAPEVVKGGISAPADVWSLGMTLVEMLTQRPPALDNASRHDPVLPETLPSLYLEIVRCCLKRDPQARWTVAAISERLNPSASAPAPTPAAIPAPPVTAKSTPSPSVAAAAPALAPMRAPAPIPSKSEPYHIPASRPSLQSYGATARGDARHHDIGLPKLKRPPLLPKANYFIFGVALGTILVTILGIKLFSHHTPVQQQASAVAPAQPSPEKAAPPATHTKAQQKTPPAAPVSSASQNSQRSSQSPSPASVKSTTEKQPVSSTVSSNPSSHSDSVSAATVPANVAANSLATNKVPGEILNQVLPEVSSKARSTIRGTVRVGVKVHVDPTGNVASAELNSPGPSRFFADLALQAAKNWDFAPAKLDGHNVASDWIIRFHFTQSDTKVFPEEASP